jgi:hypothetical protein
LPRQRLTVEGRPWTHAGKPHPHCRMRNRDFV